MSRTRTPTSTLVDFAAARAVLPEVVERLVGLIDRVPDPAAASSCPPWSVGDVAAHLSLAYLAYSSAAVGEFGEWTALIPASVADPVPRLKELNSLALEYVTPEERENIGVLLVERAKTMVETTEGRDPSEVCEAPWFGDGVQVPLGAAVGLLISESLLHGLDIARGSGQAWPIDPAEARLVVSLVFPAMMPVMVNREAAGGLTARIRLHVRGSVTIGVDVDHGEVRVEREPASGQADCHISMDPVAFLLSTSGRTSQGRAIAAGKMVPWGRRAWLAPRTARLFSFP
jgi:uncharacterized protein (TIGR03083 family)